MKILSVLGARPQFIKAAVLTEAIASLKARGLAISEYILHTGQHYDDSMSGVFFRELRMPPPDTNLAIGSGSHGAQTAEMLSGIERVLLETKPDVVVVYGDTNSTLAGALAAAKLRIRLAHVEAGLRSFNRDMPEELNRLIADRCSDILLCPSEQAVANLNAEGIGLPPPLDSSTSRNATANEQQVLLVGDIMYDALLRGVSIAEGSSHVLKDLRLRPQTFVLATVHRASNTDDPLVLARIFRAFEVLTRTRLPVIVPLHPRVRQHIGLLRKVAPSVTLIDPVGYSAMLTLERAARVVVTDSGGVQKEAYWLGVPCVTLRDETEWPETVQSGWNVLGGSDTDTIVEAVQSAAPGSDKRDAYGTGRAARKILDAILGPGFSSEPRCSGS